jgi:hypothetical protein
MAHTRPHYLKTMLLTLAVLSALVLVLLVRNRADLKVPDTGSPARGSAPTPVAPAFKTEDELARELLEKTERHPGSAVTAKTAPMWVVMRNSEPIPGSFYKPGEQCFIVENEVAELLARKKDHLILRYAPIQYRKGSTCPKGTIFYLKLK